MTMKRKTVGKNDYENNSKISKLLLCKKLYIYIYSIYIQSSKNFLVL